MCAKISIYKILFLSLLLSGCANSMYFYETEKISLTVDARPDPSQPVQGNLGIKQRVALVVPKKSNDDTGDGEALSSISSFNFRIIKKDWAFNPILVQTAFVTGEAAVKLYESPQKTAEVAEAITYRAQAKSNIETQKQRLDKILAYVTDGSDTINSTKLNDLIAKASKVSPDPNVLSPPIMDEIRKSKTRSELSDALFYKLDITISPIYEALTTDKQ